MLCNSIIYFVEFFVKGLSYWHKCSGYSCVNFKRVVSNPRSNMRLACFNSFHRFSLCQPTFWLVLKKQKYSCVINPYFLANKPARRISRGQFLALKMRVFPHYRLISRIRKFRYLTTGYLFFFLQQSLWGVRYIHYAPTHVLYNGRDDFNGGDAGTAW